MGHTRTEGERPHLSFTLIPISVLHVNSLTASFATIQLPRLPSTSHPTAIHSPPERLSERASQELHRTLSLLLLLLNTLPFFPRPFASLLPFTLLPFLRSSTPFTPSVQRLTSSSLQHTHTPPHTSASGIPAPHQLPRKPRTPSSSNELRIEVLSQPSNASVALLSCVSSSSSSTQAASAVVSYINVPAKRARDVSSVDPTPDKTPDDR